MIWFGFYGHKIIFSAFVLKHNILESDFIPNLACMKYESNIEQEWEFIKEIYWLRLGGFTCHHRLLACSLGIHFIIHICKIYIWNLYTSPKLLCDSVHCLKRYTNKAELNRSDFICKAMQNDLQNNSN